MVHSTARTIFDPKCQGSFTQRDAILQVVGTWHQGVITSIGQLYVTKGELLKAVPIIRV